MPNLVLSKEKRNEIAYKMLMFEYVKKNKMTLISSNDFKRELGNMAKSIKVEQKELASFIEHMMTKLLSNMLGKNVVIVDE